MTWFKHDELRVFIQPQAIALWRFKGVRGFKPQLAQHNIVQLSNIGNTPDDWQFVVEQLQTLLKDDKWQAVAAKVMISSHFMRYAVIPWNSEITSADERQAYLNHHFVLALGDAVKSWDMRMDAPKYRQSALASAMPSSLQLALVDVFAQANMRLRAVHPYLMQAANQALEAFKTEGSGWLTVVENQRLCVALMVDSSWRMVRNLPLETDIATQIETMIKREQMLSNTEIQPNFPLIVHWPNTAAVQVVDIAGHRVRSLVSHEPAETRQKNRLKSLDWAM